MESYTHLTLRSFFFWNLDYNARSYWWASGSSGILRVHLLLIFTSDLLDLLVWFWSKSSKIKHPIKLCNMDLMGVEIKMRNNYSEWSSHQISEMQQFQRKCTDWTLWHAAVLLSKSLKLGACSCCLSAFGVSDYSESFSAGLRGRLFSIHLRTEQRLQTRLGQRSALNRDGHCLLAGWAHRPMKMQSKQTAQPIGSLLQCLY